MLPPLLLLPPTHMHTAAASKEQQQQDPAITSINHLPHQPTSAAASGELELLLMSRWMYVTMSESMDDTETGLGSARVTGPVAYI